MIWLSFLVLVFWLPGVFYIFERFPPQKAIVFAFVVAWLFLPPTVIKLPGFPDWSKTTATVFSVFLCSWAKQPQKYLRLKFRWYDLPVVVFCLSSFVSSILNNQGAYDGLSAVLEETFQWGLPYLVGRAFLSDYAGNRQLAVGVACGGILYAPLCLFEIRMSPVLKALVYGFTDLRPIDFGLRYGGYRPMVFLSTGLELGWWMCCASFCAYLLWVSGTVKRFLGYPMLILTAFTMVVTVFCKATGALVQIVIGFALVYLSKYTRTNLLAWALIAIGPMYCVARPLGIWTGEQVVVYANSFFGPERAQSLEFRFSEEQVLIRSAMQRPLFGWSRNAGFNSIGANGREAVTDGFWIIVFGWKGFVGLAALNGMLLLPSILFLVRFRPKTWTDVDVAPVTALALILPLFMLDNLSNAMLNPIYSLAMGAVAGYIPANRRGARAKSGHESAPEFLHHITGPTRTSHHLGGPWLADEDLAEQHETDAAQAFELDHLAAADEFFRLSVQYRHQAVQKNRSPARLDRLACSHVTYARFLTQIQNPDLAIYERQQALNVWMTLRSEFSGADLSLLVYAANLNDLGWLVISEHVTDIQQIARAIAFAEEAVMLVPDQSSYWNTLGTARYRHQDFYKAIHALSRSVALNSDGGNAFDFYYLALANQALGYGQLALNWLDRAESWVSQHPDLAELLAPIRVETTTFLAASSS